MAYWMKMPENGESLRATRLIRVKPGRPIVGIVTSMELVGCYVHYFRGRSKACERADCEACREKHMPRWYGWVSIWGPKSNEHVIAEFTASCVEAIQEYRLKHGQLRGAVLTLERATAKINSRLTARVQQSTINADVLPAELDVIGTLEKIWETHHSDDAPKIARPDDLQGQQRFA